MKTILTIALCFILSSCSSIGRLSVELVNKSIEACEDHGELKSIDTNTPTGPTIMEITKVIVTCNDGEIKRVKL